MRVFSKPGHYSVLLENGVDFAAEDEYGNNALHLAVMQGRLNNVRVLLTQSNIDAETVKLGSQSPLHHVAFAIMAKKMLLPFLSCSSSVCLNILWTKLTTKGTQFYSWPM